MLYLNTRKIVFITLLTLVQINYTSHDGLNRLVCVSTRLGYYSCSTTLLKQEISLLYRYKIVNWSVLVDSYQYYCTRLSINGLVSSKLLLAWLFSRLIEEIADII